MVLERGGALVLHRCRGTAWRSTAERDGGGARVDRVPGVRPGVFKGGRAGIAAGRRGIRIPATSPVISGPLRSREGRGEEGADARGRLVSGGARVARLPAWWGQGVGGAGGMRASGRWAERVGAGNWPWAELGRSAALGKGGTGRRRERRRPGPRWAGLGKRFGLGWVLGFVGFSSLFNSKLFYS